MNSIQFDFKCCEINKMVGDQLKFLCFLTLLSLAVGAKLNVSVIDKAALRKPQLSASFNGWDPDFCNDHQDMDTFPHPDSCKEYFMCWQGELWELECDEGMLFDRWDGVCDYAEFVDCFDDECPPLGSNEVRFLPSEFCEEFYICINGQPILLFCRPGQHWNKQEEFCDDPESAGCDVSQGTIFEKQFVL